MKTEFENFKFSSCQKVHILTKMEGEFLWDMEDREEEIGALMEQY